MGASRTKLPESGNTIWISSHHQVCTVKAVDIQKLTSYFSIQADRKADSEHEWEGEKGENSRQIQSNHILYRVKRPNIPITIIFPRVLLKEREAKYKNLSVRIITGNPLVKIEREKRT